jgi:putative methylase
MNNLIYLLKQLKNIEKPNSKLEQYFTTPELAVRFLKKIDFKNKTVVDLGCGAGILGITALLLGAKKVIFLDIDSGAIEISKDNYDIIKNQLDVGEAEFLDEDISLIKSSLNVDIALLNPPFGTTDESKRIDSIFLKKAMKIAKKVLTMHKTATKEYIKSIMNENNFNIVYNENFLFPIDKVYSHHTKEGIEVQVTLFIAEKVV